MTASINPAAFRAKMLAALDLTEEEMEAFEGSAEHQAYLAAKDEAEKDHETYVAWMRGFAAGYSAAVTTQLRRDGVIGADHHVSFE